LARRFSRERVKKEGKNLGDTCPVKPVLVIIMEVQARDRKVIEDSSRVIGYV
jgi:hypothetical protein